MKAVAHDDCPVGMVIEMPEAPLPRGKIETPAYSGSEIEEEALRLQEAIKQPMRWDLELCRALAPLTLEINRLKREQGVFLIAHSYQTPDIVYGVADSVADSYSLSKDARDAPQQTILFSSVRFMAETAKIVSPHKTVLHPSPEAGCSLSDGISAQDVIDLKEAHPGVPVVCYINTSAAVKAECDVCVTSSNYIKICERLPGDRLIFVPDRFMGKHLQTALSDKEVLVYGGECEVHANFTGEKIRTWRNSMDDHGVDLVVMSHPECDADVLEESDVVGSSEILKDEALRMASKGQRDFMLVTECGTADRVLAESDEDLNLIGACVMCRHMKSTQLEDILQALRDPRADQVIELDADVIESARMCLDEMFRLMD
ncbi:MAG: quinolinate synthase [Candidatus Thalassarchaeaceae archaeon]|nr:quinolinate synthase [Candidatus Thalassarchaeaceae archaeon]MDP7257345.1 quinolinate synthase [Candidatus Thalassarchaeaceae archaeon]MDP7446699.1 quinolinate synthase [Candidatus Thalassarchaeaceae archaeon]MDP7649577.1 quinolinate synthase [Candidatus Thalassarchaeaceae archaeon]HJL54425.1 quinolinate synthase [Candidatus Thalassarchaeaceae archaeon]